MRTWENVMAQHKTSPQDGPVGSNEPMAEQQRVPAATATQMQQQAGQQRDGDALRRPDAASEKK
jgi:hypothetical protein